MSSYIRKAVVKYDYELGLPLFREKKYSAEHGTDGIFIHSVFDFVSQIYLGERKFDLFRHLHNYPIADYLT